MLKNKSLSIRFLLTIGIGIFSIFLSHYAIYIWLENNLQKDEYYKMANWANIYEYIYQNGGIEELNTSSPPNLKFNEEGSKFWAAIVSDGNVLWASKSLNNIENYSALSGHIFKDTRYSKLSLVKNGKGYFSYSTISQKNHQLILPLNNESNSHNKNGTLIISIPSNETSYKSEFLRNTLLYSITVSSIFLGVLQFLMGMWTMNPLKILKINLNKIKEGKETILLGDYPIELKEIVHDLNELLIKESKSIEAQKKSISNLTHSLKTPITIMRATLEGNENIDKNILLEQIDRLDKQITYHLSSTYRQSKVIKATNKSSTLIDEININLIEGLEKINKQKQIYCEIIGEEGLSVPMEEGDYQEVIGNLLENAFKFGNQKVILNSYKTNDAIYIEVSDDGNGIKDEDKQYIFGRGFRIDEVKSGYGIGLASVKDILDLYHFEIDVLQSDELGGAMFRLKIKTN